MKREDRILKTIESLFMEQTLGVLATQKQGEPWGSLIAFASSENLKSIFFATPTFTRKYFNLTRDSRVALVIDNRENRPADFSEAIAVTASGNASILKSPRRKEAERIFLLKHPYLTSFVKSPTCAMIEITVDRYNLVDRFQEVVELQLD